MLRAQRNSAKELAEAAGVEFSMTTSSSPDPGQQRAVVRLVRERHQVADEKLARLIDVDPVEVWRRLDAEPGDLSDLLDVANRVANVDGAVNARERGVISELQDRCGRV